MYVSDDLANVIFGILLLISFVRTYMVYLAYFTCLCVVAMQ